ncbi:MAG TPA: gliding motility-associated C-terminal domain-containing protein, partial [Bacteroidetes bacterium]|nr:gliding motility-associated C-terminal domain-containing protein [Bacteroidota bacterium]
ESGEVYLKVTDSQGCYDEDEIWINVLSKPELYIPDIFTPDYDNINDYFYVKAGRGIKSINNFYVFDRWGEKVYEKKNVRLNFPVDGWDGKFKGKEAAPGVYVYYFEVVLENGEIEKIAGDITLIR